MLAICLPGIVSARVGKENVTTVISEAQFLLQESGNLAGVCDIRLRIKITNTRLRLHQIIE